MRRVLALIFLLLTLIAFSSCGDESGANPSYLYTYAELAIDLPTSYIDAPSDSFDAFFTNGEGFVGISRLSFYGAVSDDLDGSMFPETVARKYAESNSLDVSVTDLESYSYFSYEEGGYYNLIAFYRSKYAHFIVRFMCIEEKREALAPDFLKYAESVIFTQ